MTGRFMDEYLPDRIRAYPWTSSPRFSTSITSVANASEHANQNWKNPLCRFTAPEAVRCHDDVEDLRDHWMVCRGPFRTFPIRDPLDFASRRLTKAGQEPIVGPTDQAIGIGDGLETTFQLSKTYTRGSESYTRKIWLPITETVVVAMNALPPETADPTLPGGPYTWDVVRETGQIIFDHPPSAGLIVTAGFLFDVQARFEADDSFDQIVQAFETDGFADLVFVEVRPCMSGDSET